MKYFGQYLVSKNIINEKQLVSMLVEQLRALPSYIELAFEQELLTPDQILRVIETQQTEGLDFKQSCQKLGFWNDHIHEKMEEKLAQLRTPLGQLLIKNSVIDHAKLTRLLDEFFAQIVEAPAQVKNQSAGVSSSAQENKNNNSIQSEFLEFLTETRINNIVGLSSILDGQNDLDMIRPILKELVIEVHSLKGVATLDKLEKTSDLIHRLESKITLAIAGLKQGSSKGLNHLSEAIVVFAKALEIIKQSLSKNFDESSLWTDPSFSQIVSKLNH